MHSLVSRTICIVGIGISALFMTTSAYAATATTSFSLTSTVQASCTVSASNLAFGNYTGVENDTTTSVSVSCTTTTPYNVGLNAGTASGATVSTRKMAGPSSSLLNYALYRDSAHSQVWGNTVGTDSVSGTGNGSAQSLTVYAAVPASQLVTPGSYLDTIVVTVIY